MDFEFEAEEQLIIDNFCRFLEREVRPYAKDLRDRAPSMAEAKDFFQRLTHFGIGGMYVPVQDGGHGFSNRLNGRMIEEICRIDGGLGGMVSLQDGSIGSFARMAPQHLKDRYLPDLMAGKRTLCTGITEPGVGSNPRNVVTRATPTGSGTLRVIGEKTWISNADIADLAIVVCKTSDDPRAPLSQILLDRYEHGFETTNLKKLGLNTWPTGQVMIDCEVPEANVIGVEGAGLAQTLRMFERARCFVGVVSLGIARAALEAAIDYAQTRRQWGKAIAGHQSIQIKLAEAATELDAARLLVYRGLALVDRGARCDTQTSMAKLFATEAGVRITHRCLEVFGANGLSPEFPVEKLFRDARVMTVPDGTSDIQRLLIARNLTGVSAF
ncbi:MAG: acyl-CoA dehydrogenase family protein [Rhizomicrobium sp.]